jgi:tartrate dehydratase beta subunit/fumarate hydratase class I family protein
MQTEEQQINEALKKLGWVFVGTGGGCTAWQLSHVSNKNIYYLLGVESHTPTRLDQVVTISFCDNDGETGMQIECKIEDIITGRVVISSYKM